MGVELNIDRKLRDDELLFGECQSVIIVTLEESDLYQLIIMAQKLNIHTQTIGRVNRSNKMVINDLIDINRTKLEHTYFNSLEKIMI